MLARLLAAWLCLFACLYINAVLPFHTHNDSQEHASACDLCLAQNQAQAIEHVAVYLFILFMVAISSIALFTILFWSPEFSSVYFGRAPPAFR
jgi:hypothetical protein